MPIIASILVLGIFVIGLSFDDAEAKTTIHEEKFTQYSVYVRSDTFGSDEFASFALSSSSDDDDNVNVNYYYRNNVAGEESRGSGTFEKSLIYTGDLKKKFTVNINTADLDFESKSGDDGIISIHVIKDGNIYTQKEKENSKSCQTDENTGRQICSKQKESETETSATVTGTMFGDEAKFGDFFEEKYESKYWSNP